MIVPLKPAVVEILACPCCGASLTRNKSELRCTNPACFSRFPVVGDVPILLNERTSTFQINRYLTPERPGRITALRAQARKYLPRIGANLVAKENYRQFRELLLGNSPDPKVLVIGGAEMGAGMAELQGSSISIIETDVVLGSRTQIICDAATLPFVAASVDGVIIQAVLEYVMDPAVCVREIHRVLKPGGLVYSEMPFMQQVHGGKYDFTRLTHSGHRRLYRHFAEITSGACAGPGMVLAWSVQQFFLGFVQLHAAREIVRLGAACSLFWLKYFDYFLIRQKGALDGASGTFFLGTKTDDVLSDQDLLKSYRGAVPTSGIV